MTGFVIPTLAQSVERVRRAFRVNLPGSDAWIWPNNLNPTAKVFGGVQHELFGFADYIARQKFALTADSESLDLHGSEFGLARRPASPTRFSVKITASAAISVLVGAQFRRSDNATYLATAGGASTGAGDLIIDVVAADDGRAPTPIAGTPLEIVSGVVGDDTALASVADETISPGTDVEDDETFRQRILFRKRYPPHGGAPSDYVMWAGEVPGVSFDKLPTVFVEPLWSGPGTVRIFPLMFDLYADGIPQAADVIRVKEHVEALKPAGAKVTYAAATAVPVPIVISNLSPDRSDVRDAVSAELRAAFRRHARVAGTAEPLVTMPFLASPTSFSRSWIWQAVANATGEERHVIQAPVSEIALTPGQMATLGPISFI